MNVTTFARAQQKDPSICSFCWARKLIVTADHCCFNLLGSLSAVCGWLWLLLDQATIMSNIFLYLVVTLILCHAVADSLVIVNLQGAQTHISLASSSLTLILRSPLALPCEHQGSLSMGSKVAATTLSPFVLLLPRNLSMRFLRYHALWVRLPNLCKRLHA